MLLPTCLFLMTPTNPIYNLSFDSVTALDQKIRGKRTEGVKSHTFVSYSNHQ